jgi:hypothetical protein
METQDLNPKFNTTKMPTSPLRSPQMTGSLLTLNLSKCMEEMELYL